MPDSIKPTNPYFDYTAVRNAHMFFGREDELQVLYEAGHRQQSISVVGPRRIGKTSLLRHLELPAVQREYAQRFNYRLDNRLFVFLNLRDYVHKSQDDFFHSVSEQIFQQAQKVTTLEPPAKQGEDQLSKLLEEIERLGYHPILLMDSFDKVTSNTQFDEAFLSFLRSLATRGRVSYITASLRPLYEMSHPGIVTSPFFDIFTSCKLGPLTEEAGKQLIEEPSRRVDHPFTQGETRWIRDWAGRHPFFLQVSCRFLFEEKGKHQNGPVDMELVQELVYGELFPYFEKLWGDLSGDQQKDVKQEIRQQAGLRRKHPELSESGLFQKYVRNKFQADQLEITSKDVKDALDNLEDNDFLESCKLTDTNYVLTRYQQTANSPAPKKRSLIVRDLLKIAFERLRADGMRSDAAFEWRVYNILYYHYFKYHLANDRTMARLGISSRRQYYREQEKAIQAIWKELVEIEVASLNEYDRLTGK